MDGETAAGEQAIQRLARRQRSVHARRAQPVQLVGLVDELRTGLPGQVVQRGDHVAGRNINLADRVGLAHGHGRDRTGHHEQHAA